MKKFFTLLMAMALVSMTFAQGQLINTTTQVQLPASERSDWYGFNATSGSVFVMAAESEYTLRIPAGDIPAGSTISQVRFYHTTSDHVTGYNGTFNNETYRISFYTSNVVYDAEGGSITFDPTPAYSYNYTVPEGDAGLGINVVTLPQAFTVPAGTDIVVGVYAADAAAVCLCPTDSTCADNNFALFGDEADAGYHHWVFGSEYDENNELIASHKPFLLSVYYNDGQAYQPKCDWGVAIHNPDDLSNFPDAVEELHVNNYVDSVYLNIELGNYGVDTAFGVVSFRCYIEYNGVETEIFTEDWDCSLASEGYMAPNYGWWNVAYGGILGLPASVEDPNTPSDFDDLSLGWPFNLCVHIDWTSTNGSIDPNLTNNTYCVPVINDDVAGIAENTNTLTVSPNPASTVIRVDNAAGAQISIFNIAGQEVMAIEAANANETINVANLTEGVYVVRVVNGNEVATSKVSIVR